MINTEKFFQFLSSISPLSRKFKEALSNELHIVSYPKHHFLAEEESIPNNAYFLDHGFAVAYSVADTRRIVISFFQAGDVIIEPRAFFSQSKSNVNIQLTIPGDLLVISFSSVSKLFEVYQEANVLSRVITAQFYSKSQERIVDLHNLDAWDRYIKLLDRYPTVESDASQDLIASYLNITPQSLSRLRQRRRES